MAVNSIGSAGGFNRVSGLASGMDTDSIVKNMMKIQQSKYDKMYQVKTRDEWKRDAYTDVNNALRKFKDEYASFLNNKSNMLSVSTYKSTKADVPANPSLSVTVNATASEGSYTVSVQQLAQGAKMSGAKASDSAEGFSSTTLGKMAIGSLAGLAGGQTVSGEIRFSINDTAFTFQSTDTMKTVMDTVNNSAAGVTMSYTQLTDTFVFETKAKGAYVPGMVQPNEPAAFSYTYDGTLTKPADRQEPADGAGQADLEAYRQYRQELEDYTNDFDTRKAAAQQAHQMSVAQYNKDKAAYAANEARRINVTDSTGFLSAIGLDPATAAKTDGKSARATINGVSVTRDSNNFEIDGVGFQLTKETTSDITFSVKRDTQQSMETIKGFVNSLNKLMETVYGKLTEKKNYGYAPLTSEQRGDMSAEDIALWDTKAKSGLLTRDPALQKLMDRLQSAFTSQVDAVGSPSSVGVGSAGYRVGQPAQLQIDEDKLRKALEEDPDKVFKLFTAREEDGKGNLFSEKSGVVTRMTNAMDQFTSTTKDVSLKALDAAISDMERKMGTENTRLYKLQESYYKKFAAMEAALTKMQSQTSALSGFGT